jgi:hypothetical protein
VLVPATMALLGERNWWLPRGLDRLLPHVDPDAAVPVTPLADAPLVDDNVYGATDAVRDSGKRGKNELAGAGDPRLNK